MDTKKTKKEEKNQKEENKEIPLYSIFKIENDIYEIWIKDKGKILFSYPKILNLFELKDAMNNLMGIIDKTIEEKKEKEKEEFKKEKVPIETK